MIKECFSRYLEIDLSDKQLWQFKRYYELLVEWNNKFNLTAITDYESVIYKHFIDSVYLMKYANLSGKVVDVGCGAGFPGIPLKIMNPTIDLTLVESNSKKTSFINTLVAELDLSLSIINKRGEDLQELQESFDFGVTRAVTNQAALNEIMIPLLKVGGCFYSMKGLNYEGEYTSLSFSTFGAHLDKIYTYNLPPTNDNRAILFIIKDRRTPDRFPRNYASIKKGPIR